MSNHDYEEVQDLLEELQSALEDGDTESARATLEDLEDEYRAVRIHEAFRTERARAGIQDAATPFEDARSLDRYIHESTRASLRRAAVFATARPHVERPGDIDAQPAIDAIDTALDAEETVVQQESDTGGLTAGVSVPPRPVLVGFDPSVVEIDAEADFEFELTVVNAGTEPTDSLSLGLSADDGLDLDEDEMTVESLGSGVEETVDVAGEADSDGIFTVRAVLETGANATQSSDATVWAGETPDLGGGGPVDGALQWAERSLPGDMAEWGPVAGGVGVAGLGSLGAYRYLRGGEAPAAESPDAESPDTERDGPSEEDSRD